MGCEGTFLSIDYRGRMNSGLYTAVYMQTPVFQIPLLICVTFILDFVLIGAVVLSLPCLLIISHMAPASGGRKEQQQATPKQCYLCKHCLRSDSSPSHKRVVFGQPIHTLKPPQIPLSKSKKFLKWVRYKQGTYLPFSLWGIWLVFHTI